MIKSTVAQALRVALSAGRSWSVNVAPSLLRGGEEAHALDQPLHRLWILAVVPAADVPLRVDHGEPLVVGELRSRLGVGCVEARQRQLEALAHERIERGLLAGGEGPAR